jgi:hypothetical protein
MQREVGEKNVEVREVRKNERKLETTRKASVEKDDGCGFIIIP